MNDMQIGTLFLEIIIFAVYWLITWKMDGKHDKLNEKIDELNEKIDKLLMKENEND